MVAIPFPQYNLQIGPDLFVLLGATSLALQAAQAGLELSQDILDTLQVALSGLQPA